MLLVYRYGAAEEDCSTALALDDSYVKAYLRRGAAREKMGKLEEAREGKSNESWAYCDSCSTYCLSIMCIVDFQAVLKLKLGNKLAKAQLASLEEVSQLDVCA